VDRLLASGLKADLMSILVVCDLDGTLVDADGTTAALNQLGLEAAVEHGWTCAAATGRPSRRLDVIAPYQHLFTKILSCNGAEELTAQGFRVTHPLPAMVARRVVAAVRDLTPAAVFAVEFGDCFGYEPGYASWPATDRDPTAIIASAEDLVAGSRPIAKLLVKADSHRPDTLVEEVLRLAGGDVSATHSNQHGSAGPIEIGNVEATKGASVTRLARDLGFNWGDIVAFGDQLNDLTMLSLAGRSFVAGESTHPALASFERLDNRNGDAVGRWLLEAVAAGR
jgi:hydroxymethylpyrimidine pyrophosphatase-like HAD family hydrolase